MYWCQDRCGTDVDTCCQTPDGQYNLCGLGQPSIVQSPNQGPGTNAQVGTICCGFGCYPSRSHTCNVNFSCTVPNGEVIPPAAPNSTSQLTHKPTTHHPSIPPPGKATTKTVVSSVKQPSRRSSNQPQHTLGLLTESFESTTGTHSNQPTGPALGKPEKSIEAPLDQPTIAPWNSLQTSIRAAQQANPLGNLIPQINLPRYLPSNLQSTLQAPTSHKLQMIDTRTATLPLVTSTTTFITVDHTFTLTPPSHTGQAVETLVIDGTSTATLPRISKTMTLTTLGLTLTLAPPSLTKTDLPLSRTASITGSSSTLSLTSSRVTEGRALTTESQIITPRPNISSTNTVSNPQFPTTTASQTSDVVGHQPLPIYDEWPSDAVIVTTCIRFGSINIKGWKLNLPSGIYPHGRPPSPNIKLPPGINFQGELPPWPKFTVGAKGFQLSLTSPNLLNVRPGQPHYAQPPHRCSISPTTATLSCTPTPTGKDRRQVETRIRTLDTISMGINFWRVYLTPSQVQHVKGIPNYVIGGFDVGSQMSICSARSLPNWDRPYIFDKSARKDIPAYIVDTGAQIDHPVRMHTRRGLYAQKFNNVVTGINQGDRAATRAEFIYAYEDHDHAENLDPRDDAGMPRNGICPPARTRIPHGTTMLGAVMGAKLGIAKKIKPYIVRTPRRDPRGSNPMAEDYVLGYQRSVTAIRTVERYISVAGAGNVPSSIIKGWPSLFGANVSTLTEDELQGWLDIPQILVVGAVETVEGKISSNSGWDKRRHIPDVHAPGVDIIVADGNKGEWARNAHYKQSDGTSLVWNGAEWNGVGHFPYEWSIFQLRANDKLTDQCMAAATSTGDPAVHSSKAV
ncbi:hypothetical protein BDDG_06554 [Blastomyces dermatitidis ATCC 18188]|uniref:Peptidase S8/S53 domain-containing protein n=1 Tax=Ajellomyces dermatitidis (strain ATCC 18188 / CBS 674.68) TaxID=653446 RepID=F2TK47_AJEDA|nr:hypothetical protein BDDG_06554 [Blastomyces dermatitidis ATCC 18188]